MNLYNCADFAPYLNLTLLFNTSANTQLRMVLFFGILSTLYICILNHKRPPRFCTYYVAICQNVLKSAFYSVAPRLNLVLILSSNESYPT